MIRALLLAGVCATLAACADFVPDSTSDQIATLTRGSHPYTDDAGRSHQVSWLVAGEPDAPRVVFVHGSPGGAWTWADELVEPLPNTEVIAVDRPGFGDSDDGRAITGYLEQARALEPLLVERDGRWPIFVGHSHGAPIVATLAALHPGRVGGLVLVSGNFDPALEYPRSYNQAGAVLRPVLGRMIRHSNDEMMAARDEALGLESILADIRCPVTIVHGTEDGLVPVENVSYVRRLLVRSSHVEVHVREGANHFIPWSDPGSIRRALASMQANP